MSDMTRRETIGAAVVGLTAGSAAVTGTADAASSGAPTLPHDPVTAKFSLPTAKPTVVTPWGTVTECTAEKFPIMQGSEACMFLLVLNGGGLREPHWHPNAWELDYVVYGSVVLGVVNPDGTQQEVTLNEGDIGFVPQGWAHYIENKRPSKAKVAITFNNNDANDIGLSTMFGGMPTGTFTQTLGLKPNALNGAKKVKKTRFIVP